MGGFAAQDSGGRGKGKGHAVQAQEHDGELRAPAPSVAQPRAEAPASPAEDIAASAVGVAADAPEAELVVLLGEERFVASRSKNAEFFQRVEGSWLEVCAHGPSRELFRRGPAGEIVLRDEHLPSDVVRAMPEIWHYLLTGHWRSGLRSLSEVLGRSSVLSFFGIRDPTIAALGNGYGCLVFSRSLLRLPADFEVPIVCTRIDAGSCNLQWCTSAGAVLGHSGCRELAAVEGAVELDPDAGTLFFKSPASPEFLFASEHALLKHKQLATLIVRRYKSRWRRFGEGFMIFLKVVPRNQSGAFAEIAHSPFAHWPCFWFVACLRQENDVLLEAVNVEILPAGVSVFADGAVVVVSHPEHLQKARLAVFRSDGDFLDVPAAFVRLVAPAPFKPCQMFEPFRKGGKGKNAHPYDHQVRETGSSSRSVSTWSPEGRAPAKVWIVCRDQRITVIIHAADGRVAVGHVNGETLIPKRGAGVGYWNLWGHRHSSEVQQFTRRQRHRYRVPICREVLAVLPRAQELAVLARSGVHSGSVLWRIPLDGQVDFVSDRVEPRPFFRKGAPRGEWADHAWHSGVNGRLPSDLASGYNFCEAMPDAKEQPIFEFQVWSLTDQSDVPVLLPSTGYDKGSRKGYYRAGLMWQPGLHKFSPTVPDRFRLHHWTCQATFA